jgi:hypothetical protein
VVDSTIARGGETPVAWRSVCVHVAAGAHNQKPLCRALGGKGRAGSLPQSSTLTTGPRHDVIIARHNSRNTLLPGPTGNQSHLGHLDFLSERHGDGANFCVFIAEKDGESE